MSLTSLLCGVNIIPKSCSKRVNGPDYLKSLSIPTAHPNSGSAFSSCGCKNPVAVLLKSKAKKKPNYSKMLVAKDEGIPVNDEWLFYEQENAVSLEWSDEVDEGSPWEGAVVYKRSALTSHLEYCTTLERLGLGKLSSKVSRSRASVMGLRVTKSVKDYVEGTPVLISVDVTEKQNRLRLDGLLKTVITLSCNRCGEPSAEDVFLNFSLLLTEEPIKEPELIDMGVIYEEDRFKDSAYEFGDDDDDAKTIDLDDWLYFPPRQKEIDISKHIRDMVHLQIRIDRMCDPSCKGLCLQCGANLNSRSCNCNCTGENVEGAGYVIGPLGNLRKQMMMKRKK
ncbi:hypothetical protein Dimus_010005 [Dionaea muscipula]